MEIKERKEKGRNLIFDKLKMQPYLFSDKLNSNEAIFLFKIRSRMLDVRKNFEKKYLNNMICQVCLSHSDTQEGVLTCPVLNAGTETVKYGDLFSNNLDIVIPALKKYRLRWKKRESLLSRKN